MPRLQTGSSSGIKLYYLLLVTLMLLLAYSTEKGAEVFLINGMHNASLDMLFSGITYFGNSIYFIPVIILLAFNSFRYALILSLSGIAHGLFVFIFKRLIFPAAGRPTSVLDVSQLYFIPGVEVHRAMSFPSGHTATAFTFAVFMSLYFRHRWVTILLSALALLTGISRIYLLQHFGQDVAFGALIGMATAVIADETLAHVRHPAWLDNRLKFNFTGAGNLPRLRKPRIN